MENGKRMSSFKGWFYHKKFNFPSFILVERESAGADKMAEREFALPDVAMELPSYVPDDRWDRGAGPSNVHPFGVEVNTSF